MTEQNNEQKVDEQKPEIQNTTPAQTVLPQVTNHNAKLNAFQKLTALENAFIDLDKRTILAVEMVSGNSTKCFDILTAQVKVLAQEIDNLGMIVKRVSQKVNATIRAGEENKLSKDSVEEIVIKENIKEMENTVSLLAKQGVLTLESSRPVDDRSFVVGVEVDEEGRVINQRMQFAIAPLDEDGKALFKNAIVGSKIQTKSKEKKEDNVVLDEFFEITELYTIAEIKKDIKFDDENESKPEDKGEKDSNL